MVSACRAIGQRLSKGGHSRRHLGGAHSYTLPLRTCWQRRHERQLLLGAYNSWGEAATPFNQTKRTHNRQVIQFSVWWAPGKSVLHISVYYYTWVKRRTDGATADIAHSGHDDVSSVYKSDTAGLPWPVFAVGDAGISPGFQIGNFTDSRLFVKVWIPFIKVGPRFIISAWIIKFFSGRDGKGIQHLG